MQADNIGVVGVQFQLNGVNLGAEDIPSLQRFLEHTRRLPTATAYINRHCIGCSR